MAGQLGQDYAKLRETSRDAREDRRLRGSREGIENKLGPTGEAERAEQGDREKLAVLNAMAEHVSQKTRVLEAEAHRRTAVTEAIMSTIWSGTWTSRSATDEGLRQAARGEEIAARMDKLVEDATFRIDTAAKVRDEFVQETARMEKEGRALATAMRTNVEQLSLEKQESEVLYARLRALRESVQAAEERMDALGVKERHLSHLPQRVDEFGKMFETLLGRPTNWPGSRPASNRCGKGSPRQRPLRPHRLAIREPQAEPY